VSTRRRSAPARARVTLADKARRLHRQEPRLPGSGSVPHRSDGFYLTRFRMMALRSAVIQ
jgi:hypothetical protein